MGRMKALLLSLLIVCAGACAHTQVQYDQVGYRSVAHSQMTLTELTVAACDAHDRGADALMREGNGVASMLLGPGVAIHPLAAEHRVQAVACRQALILKDLGVVAPEIEADILNSYRTIWGHGLKITE